MTEISGRLSGELLRVLADRWNTCTYAAGETLIREGETSDTLYVLLSGRLKAFTIDAKGREFNYSTIEPGEIFGEMFLDGEARSASVSALTTSRCAVIASHEALAFMHDHPDFTECLIVKLVSRLRHTTRKLRSLTGTSVYERTVALLNETAVVDGDVHRIPRKLTQQEIANHVGASREMVNHVFRDLMEGGFIAREQKRGMVIIKKLPVRW